MPRRSRVRAQVDAARHDLGEILLCSHGVTFAAWLRDNTQECKCDDKYGNDETRQRGVCRTYRHVV